MRGIPIVGVIEGHGARVRPAWALLAGLEARVVAALRRGEATTGTLVRSLAGNGTTASDIERALCDLTESGAIVPRSATEPIRAGSPLTRAVTYWRLSDGDRGPCP